MTRSTHSRCFLFGITAIATVLGIAGPTYAQTAYSLRFVDTNTASLIRYSLTNPGAVTTIGNLSGEVTTLDGLDFRASNGLLYGYSQLSNKLVAIDVATASTTLVTTLSTAATTQNLGLDFNPMADRLRLVDSLDQNLRINVDATTPNTTPDGALSYITGDPGATGGVNGTNNPTVIEAAYTNNVAGATSTSLFYIDSRLDTLVTTDSPNTGALRTVGSLGVNVDGNTGFDIYTTSSGVNLAFAKFRVTGANGLEDNLYSIDLGTGAASFIGNISNPTTAQTYGLAITPFAAAAPEPGSIALIGAGLLSVAGMVVRRRAA